MENPIDDLQKQQNIEDIKKTFQAYTDAFSTQIVSNLLPYFYFPTLLIDREKEPVTLESSIIGRFKASIGLNRVIKALQKQGFGYSKLDNEPQVKLLRENLAIASGHATRFTKDDHVLERFGYTYTFRKKSDAWKIVAGIIHD